MTTQAAHLPYQGLMAGFRRFSVAEYHRLIQIGLLTESARRTRVDGHAHHS